jgi:hypothetical protein
MGGPGSGRRPGFRGSRGGMKRGTFIGKNRVTSSYHTRGSKVTMVKLRTPKGKLRTKYFTA